MGSGRGGGVGGYRMTKRLRGGSKGEEQEVCGRRGSRSVRQGNYKDGNSRGCKGEKGTGCQEEHLIGSMESARLRRITCVNCILYI